MTIAHRRAESETLCCTLSGFIQSMAKTMHHFQNANLSLCGEYYI